MFRKTLSVAANERALIFKNNKLTDIKTVGIYKYFGFNVSFLKYDISKYQVLAPSVEKLVDDYKDIFEHMVEKVSIAENECGLIYRNGLLTEILDPAQNLYFWKTNSELTVKKVDLSEQFEVDPSLKCHLIR
jgi:hypothetical protein